jgi:hypothetical protein
MPRFIQATARRRESNAVLLNWRSVVAQFEAVHGELPSQLTVFEIGERFVKQNWGPVETVERIVHLMTQHLFANTDTNSDLQQELTDFVMAHHADLSLKMKIRQVLSPRLAWKLAGGFQSRR